MQLDVAVPDGRIINVNVDSASTSYEICEMIASNINVKDSFGFSLHITVNQRVRVHCVLDHVTPFTRWLCFLDTFLDTLIAYKPTVTLDGSDGSVMSECKVCWDVVLIAVYCITLSHLLFVIWQ